jgi:hypothetical protein
MSFARAAYRSCSPRRGFACAGPEFWPRRSCAALRSLDRAGLTLRRSLRRAGAYAAAKPLPRRSLRCGEACAVLCQGTSSLVPFLPARSPGFSPCMWCAAFLVIAEEASHRPGSFSKAAFSRRYALASASAISDLTIRPRDKGRDESSLCRNVELKRSFL